MNQKIDSIFYKDSEWAKMIISKLEVEVELRKLCVVIYRSHKQSDCLF